MSTQLHIDLSIEGFARISARLNEGFDDRATVLQSASLNEPSWARFEAQYATLLADDADGALTRRFTDAYAAECLLARTSGLRDLPAHDPRFLNDNAQPWREEAAAVSIDPSHPMPPALDFSDADTEDPTWGTPQPISATEDADRTAEFTPSRPRPVLPFSGAHEMDDSGVRPSPTARPPAPPARVALASPDTTLEVSVSATRVPVLPFATPSAPGRRLHRFDTQTGLPLAIPYWVDDAADPTKSA